MSSDLVLRATVDDTSADGDLDIRFENTTGTPIVSAALTGDGTDHPGQYVLTFTNSGGVTVAIAAETTKNPYNGVASVSITADGVTVNEAGLPCALVVSAGVLTNHEATITIGDRLDGSAVITDYLNAGVTLAGASQAGVRVSAVNVGADDGAACKIVPCPGFHVTGTGCDTYVHTLDNHTSESREQLALPGDFAMTYVDWASASPCTADIYIDGDLAIAGAKFDGTTRYQHGSANGYSDANDKLLGLSIIFANVGSDPSALTHTIKVRNGYSWVQYASDSSGSPGTWGTAGASLTLTESGEPSGTITSGGKVIFWARVTVPDSESPQDQALIRHRLRHNTI